MLELLTAPNWSWDIPALTAEFLGLLLVNFVVGFLIAKILKRLFGLGVALILLIIILGLYAGVYNLRYSGLIDEALPTLIQYTDVLYDLLVAKLPWSALAMLFGFAEGFYGLTIARKG